MTSLAPGAGNGRLRRRLSPLARHLAWLTLYYLVMAGGILLLWRVMPAIAPTRAPKVTEAPTLAARARGILLPIAAMLGAVLLALPVAWVYLITRRKKGFTQSIVHTLIVLPVAVAGIMVLVQNSLALAFSLAGIAALRFRNTLDDTKDAVYLFVGTGIGIAAAVDQLDVGLALSFIFNVAVLVLWWTDVGRTPARLKAKLTLRRLRQTMETRVPVGIAGAARDPLNAVLRVHATDADPAQGIVERLFADAAKQWELTGLTRGDQGQSQLDYVVRLRPRTRRGDLLRELRDRGSPHITGAEFR